VGQELLTFPEHTSIFKLFIRDCIGKGFWGGHVYSHKEKRKGSIKLTVQRAIDNQVLQVFIYKKHAPTLLHGTRLKFSNDEALINVAFMCI
jgi:hypothetical protein